VTAAPLQVWLRQRRLYMARTAYDTHFGGGASVILLRQGADLLVLPVRHAASGGYVLKIRNAAGDRVVDAGDYFRDQGLADNAEWQAAYSWCDKAAGLQLYEVFLM